MVQGVVDGHGEVILIEQVVRAGVPRPNPAVRWHYAALAEPPGGVGFQCGNDAFRFNLLGCNHHMDVFNSHVEGEQDPLPMAAYLDHRFLDNPAHRRGDLSGPMLKLSALD